MNLEDYGIEGYAAAEFSARDERSLTFCQALILKICGYQIKKLKNSWFLIIEGNIFRHVLSELVCMFFL